MLKVAAFKRRARTNLAKLLLVSACGMGLFSKSLRHMPSLVILVLTL